MPPVRGRPPKVDSSEVKRVLMHNKDRIINKCGIQSKTDPIWRELAKSLGDKCSANTLYTIVTCNKFGVRDELVGPKLSTIEKDMSDSYEPENDEDGVPSSASDDENKYNDSFTIPLLKSDFQDLITDRYYKRCEKSRNNKQYIRQCLVLEPGLWQDFITRELWNAVKLKCGFQFRNLKLRNDGKLCTIRGKCRCGTSMVGEIDASNEESTFAEFKCTLRTADANGMCGKRYLRNPLRQRVARELQHKSAVVYQAEKANELKREGDPDPPHLYSLPVLNTAKKELKASKFLTPDPIISLGIKKSYSLRNDIQSIGLDPFYVHYGTNHQNHMYREYTRKFPPCISIDATGSICKPIEKPDKRISPHIFLYQCVINFEKNQFPVTQILSEVQNAGAITSWLLEWVRRGATSPKEVICDASKALLNAVTFVFTGYHTIMEYSNACFPKKLLPRCFIRIDNAHFINTYSKFLRNTTRLVRIFFLSLIGKLIVVKNMEEACKLLKTILVISQSETDGEDCMGQETPCQRYKKEIIKESKNGMNNDEEIECNITNDIEDNIFMDVVNVEQSAFEDIRFLWSSWAQKMNEEISPMCKIKGDNINALYNPDLAKKLIKDMSLFPVWSCVMVNEFGYGRIPATSAPVESDFNLLKTHLLKNHSTPMRVDEFVELHLDFLNGRLKSMENSNNTGKSDPTSYTVKYDEVFSRKLYGKITICLCLTEEFSFRLKNLTWSLY